MTLSTFFNGTILGKSGKTFIFGPWEKDGAGRAQRRLAEDQVFTADNPPQQTAGAAAALDPDDLSIHPASADVPAGKASLRGRLMRLALEKPAGRISASIFVGRTDFILYLDPETLSRTRYQPGDTVLIAYRPDRVQWYRASAD